VEWHCGELSECFTATSSPVQAKPDEAWLCTLKIYVLQLEGAW
jgi:hypothetical protein